jgi:hypothetical protein
MITRENILSEIKRITQEEKSDTLSLSDFEQKTGISSYHVYRVFDTWEEAILSVGLKPLSLKKIDVNDLFDEMKNVFNSEKQIVTSIRFSKLSKYSISVYKRRFGSWDNILYNFRKWIIENKIEFMNINDLPNNNKENTIDSENAGEDNFDQQGNSRNWPKSDSNSTYGELINFRGLQHAPVNEQGVVFLFGMIASEIGFLIESVQVGFPDCEGKRKIGKDKWQRVRIEFEYLSSHFKDHGHNINKCDLIICWKNNWSDCPIEVIELRKEIELLND